MTKIYKPLLYAIAIFLLVLLMHYMRSGMLEPVQAFSLGGFFMLGLALGVLGDLVEQGQHDLRS
ncbi:hypothetical protein FVR03_18965 [Pontibacter qinzhouensis]|uniref:Uncharacterized protein n=1 Tax=Pontibacter qinzhouensis TaxID=2603253 RepID=A0A5C8J8Z2_9BACT|nr:hypothetical protein [Pontibacter qinzhouensis]TXK33741.1 hypothetical protein FVR03_18965 [Pontibacter qinzhouensis]